MNPFLKAGLIIGRCVVFAGVSFITYQFARNAAWEAVGEAGSLWLNVMTSNGEQSFESVVESTFGADA